MHNLKFIAYRSKRCEDAEKLRNEVDEFVDFIQERENLKQLIADVEEKLTDYWNIVSETDNEARYHHGKILVFAATFVVPGLGQLTKIKKVKKILEWIKKATPNELLGLKLRFTDDLTSVVDDVLKKAGDAFLQAKNQSKVWSGYDCSEIAEDIFEAVGEGKIIRIEAKNGNWLKVKQKGVVEEFQYHEIYLYKDNVYDVRFDDGPVSYDNFMQHIYEANSIDITTTIIRQ